MWKGREVTYDRDEGRYPAVVLNPSGTLESCEELFKTSEDPAPPHRYGLHCVCVA